MVRNQSGFENILLTLKDDVSLYQKVNEMFGNEFDLEDYRRFTKFDDKTHKITFLNHYNSENNLEGKLDIVDFSGKNVFVATTQSSEVHPMGQLFDQVRAIDGVVKRNANLAVALNPYLFLARADGDSEELKKRYLTGEKLSDKEMEKVKQRVNSTDDLQVYIKMLMLFGTDSIISFDIHNESDVVKFANQINSEYNLGKDMDKFLFNLDTLPLFTNHIKHGLPYFTNFNYDPKNIVVSSTDEGSYKTMQRACKLLGDVGWISCKKVKVETEEGYKTKIVVDDSNIDKLEGKTLLLFDDCMSTFNTINDTVKVNKKEFGSPDIVIASITHPTLYTDYAFRNLRRGRINVLTSNTRSNVGYHGGRDYKRISVLDISPYIYHSINSCFTSSGIIPFNDVFDLTDKNVVDSLYNITGDKNRNHKQKPLISYNH